MSLTSSSSTGERTTYSNVYIYKINIERPGYPYSLYVWGYDEQDARFIVFAFNLGDSLNAKVELLSTVAYPADLYRGVYLFTDELVSPSYLVSLLSLSKFKR